MASDPHLSAMRKNRRVGQWFLLGMVLFTLGGVMAAAQWRDYSAISTAERTQLRTQAKVIDGSLTTQIQSADAALRTILASMERWRKPNGYLPFAQEHLNHVANMMTGIHTVAVIGPNGICQLSNRSELVGRDVSGREYFQQAVADKTGALLHIAPPHQTVLNVWSMSVSRSIVRPNGEFDGVVVATLSPDYFESLMKNLQYAPDLWTTLIHSQGDVYVSLPPGLHLWPKSMLVADSLLASHLASGLPEADFVRPWPDGKQHMVATRTVTLQGLHASHQFVAVAAREVDAVYAPWRVMSAVLLSIWLAIVALSCWAMQRHQRSKVRLAAQVKSAQQAAHHSHQRFEQLAQTIPCMLFDFEVSAQGGIQMTYVGPYSQTLVGIAPEMLLDNYAIYLQHIHADDRPGFQTIMSGGIAARTGYECEYRFLRPDGVQRWLKTSATPGESARGLGATHFSGFVIDITDTKSQQLALREMAYQDPLTQADNRRSFLEKLQAEIGRVQRYGEPAALLMLDIDFFKRINDTYGHLVGDAVLKHLVAVLREGLRGVDSLGRLGGEEFAVLLPGTSLEAALQLAERLRQAVQASPDLGAGQTVSFTISLGVVPITTDMVDLKTVLHLADTAMYHAKQTGRNRVCTAAEASPSTLQSALD